MNTGIIATRYATALLKLVDETGSGSAVVDQVRIIEKALDELLDFRRAVSDPTVAPARKLALFEAALCPGKAVSSSAPDPTLSDRGPVEGTGLAPDLRKFLELLIRNGRIGDVRLVLATFIIEYYRSRHIKRARLVVADPALLSSSSVSGADSSVAEPDSPVAGSDSPVAGSDSPVAESDSSVAGSAGGTVVRQTRLPEGDSRRPGSLESRLRELIGKETGCELLLETKVDPSLIGGFVFEVEDMILDASVSRQLDFIRRQFIEKNRRIV